MPDTASPRFRHPPIKGSWSIIVYGGRAMGEELQPLEFNYQSKADALGMIERAKFEAQWHYRDRVKVRDRSGTIIFDGPREN